MDLDVFLDVICPWCHLGHRRLRTALDRLGDDAGAIRIRWRAFQLDPHAGSSRRELGEAIDARYGPGAFAAMSRRLTRMGAEEGIDFRFDIAQRVSTLDAHRLVQWAQATDPDRAEPLLDSLFHAYFSEGADISDATLLVDRSGAVGLDRDQAGEVLASGAFADRVAADMAEAGEIGVTGVPAVVFRGATVIPGAQDADTTERVLRRLLTRVA